jgi:HD superfamily phosphohydrolase
MNGANIVFIPFGFTLQPFVRLNKRKLINDPVYGFVNIPTDLIFDIIEQPLFQRLRRIKQMGLCDYVYPGALHTRFHHALGAMHLMSVTLDSLCAKGHDISDKEYEAAMVAILLHDAGHGPFSHALEHSILDGVRHETLSYLLMKKLNGQMGGSLEMALQMFNGTYPRKFFCQLVASQLDIDRLDYLNRDSFFTGVSEGTIGANRIIKMLDIVGDRLVVEEKGIYSIENFLNARRLMYWQVYLHKTTISAEMMLVGLIRRARELLLRGEEVQAMPDLHLFIRQQVRIEEFESDPRYLEAFIGLDDSDIWNAVKMWTRHPDRVLSVISRMLLERKLFKILLTPDPPGEAQVRDVAARLRSEHGITDEELPYFLISGSTSNAAYTAGGDKMTYSRKKAKLWTLRRLRTCPISRQ